MLFACGEEQVKFSPKFHGVFSGICFLLEKGEELVGILLFFAIGCSDSASNFLIGILFSLLG